ncbi:alpha/beta fold hydrolase [Virgisporangium aurantiacum]|uniref:Hydrolase n=1 Tax=Virgisporangium aurantiacum TaxID=175570 RepID=A0A8J3ZGD0_9ACTN|nr:alpha/beta hydrolase [Virgisporangium aurantiacum]GIJ61101.1 hydrolase [Virgisporangium aurantiacum]
MNTRFAVNGGVRLAYDDPGPGTGDPLLMIMGTGASRFWWPQGLLQCLREHGFRPAVFDLRDAGESTHPHAAYGAEDLVDDAAAVLDALGWPAAHVFGLSLGGVVAQRLALRHPDRVLTVTSFASGPSDAGVWTVFLRYLRWGRQLRMLRILRGAHDDDLSLGLAVLRATSSAEHPAEESVARDATDRERAHGISGFRDLAAQRRQSGARWHGPPLRELRKPVLVMCGDADPVMRPRASRDTAAAISGARLVILPGVGHSLPSAIWPTVARELRALAHP